MTGLGKDTKVSVEMDPRDRRMRVVSVARLVGAVIGWTLVVLAAWWMFG